MFRASTRVLQARAPAKLNLFLHVTGRLPNGYHSLQTLFVFLNLCDTLEFKQQGSGIRLVNDPTGSGEDNLILKAGRALAARLFPSSDPPGVEIHLDKRIPWAAGLGGGSSDAATTLLALQRLWERELPRDELLRLAAHLGADVPVFINGLAAWADGVGERLHAIDLPQGLHAVLLFPPFGVSTADVFRHPDLARNTPAIQMPGGLKPSDAFGWQQWLRGTANDLWPAAASLQPRLADCAKLFNAVLMGDETFRPWLPPRMSGSGSTLFALYHDRSGAEAAVDRLRHALADEDLLEGARCLVSPVDLANDIFSGYT